ncbi:MAG: hypothetical protein JWO36_4970 [Myxococcales bacterium]|nr:hypothetical protein [Myxococcales bacterium]
MPVASLQSYRTVSLRVHSTAFAAQGQAMFLESAVLDKLHRQCGFEQIRPGATPADIVLDLNITQTGRGGGGWLANSNLATIDTLLVLTDGQEGELLGTVRIHGQSSGMLINNAPPENEAIDVVAKTIADMLAKSGCSGPRIARIKAPPPGPDPVVDTGSAAPPPPDETHRTEAEALNEQGKQNLYAADLAGALAAFQQANALLPDARYEFNVCLALGAQEQWDNAITACRQANALHPQPKLATKIDHRLELLQHHQ